MEVTAIILFLVGLVAFLSYRRGKLEKEEEYLKAEVKSNDNRKAIRNMSDGELDDELRDYWK